MTDFATRFSAPTDFPREMQPEAHEFNEEATIAAIRDILCGNEAKLPRDVILTERDPQTGQPIATAHTGASRFLSGLLSRRS